MNRQQYAVRNEEEARIVLQVLEGEHPGMTWCMSESKPTQFLPEEYPCVIDVDDTGLSYSPVDSWLFVDDRSVPFPNQEAPDPVNHPKHYTDGRIEVIDYIEDKKLGYHLGNAVKYISRAGKKDPEKEVEDLQKAVWYINRKIEKLQQAKAARRQELEACRS